MDVGSVFRTLPCLRANKLKRVHLHSYASTLVDHQRLVTDISVGWSVTVRDAHIFRYIGLLENVKAGALFLDHPIDINDIVMGKLQGGTSGSVSRAVGFLDAPLDPPVFLHGLSVCPQAYTHAIPKSHGLQTGQSGPV